VAIKKMLRQQPNQTGWLFQNNFLSNHPALRATSPGPVGRPPPIFTRRYRKKIRVIAMKIGTRTLLE
jgi:hypothetical protein